jgi:hypothetical protein
MVRQMMIDDIRLDPGWNGGKHGTFVLLRITPETRGHYLCQAAVWQKYLAQLLEESNSTTHPSKPVRPMDPSATSLRSRQTLLKLLSEVG